MATNITAGDLISPSTTKLGWIGTGVMGSSMCSHLLKAGYTVNVFTRTQSKAQSLLSMGAHWVDSPRSVAAQSDVVLSIVGYPSDVRQVMLDPTTGALSGLRPGGVLVDMTTSDPSLAEEIHAAAAAAGCFSIDAPVSGGDRGARSASLSIFAGGEQSVVTRLTPLFDHLGRVYYMGGPGKGQFCKLGNQVTIASTMVGLCEGLIYAHKAGLDLSNYLNAISTGAAGSKSLDLYGNRILNRDFEAGFYHWLSSSIYLSKLTGREIWVLKLLFWLSRGSTTFHLSRLNLILRERKKLKLKSGLGRGSYPGDHFVSPSTEEEASSSEKTVMISAAEFAKFYQYQESLKESTSVTAVAESGSYDEADYW
ncbi:unnamed protein product [Fraxinus pennsylvanica]|uniref:Uncharacterized protein n=1 Tax=Fraxinus pennsylvanica TaxID=56036 RepID=A0AAD1ZEF1_9LAMI|nr:unnamed protein product [Fraxinus pennsylvanica]